MAQFLKAKKRTISRIFVIPLALVMLIQAFAAIATLMLSGTAGHLDEYSAGIMGQIVRNRNLIMENSMIHRWSDISNECQIANANLKQVLNEAGIGETDFLQNEEAKTRLLGKMLLPSISMLRRNGVNGVYIVLADGFSEKTDNPVAESAYKCSGIYFRDSDSYVNPKDYSDLLMVRGDYGFSHKLNIPFDVTWTAKFNFKDRGVSAGDDFFYKPYQAAMDNKGAAATDLAYWGKLFSLEDNKDDSYEMISYSMPLISESGLVYGVLGVELSRTAIDGLLPESELNSGRQSGYVLAEYQADRGLVPFYLKGAAIKRNVKLDTPLTLTETKYAKLFKMEGVSENYQSFYADVTSFSIYNPHTPFAENSWALIGVQDEEGLFGMRKHTIYNVILVITASLLLGFLFIYMLMKHLTKPITDLADWIRNVKRSTQRDYKQTDIREIDDLYDAVYDMNEKQKNAEYAVLEEKERYLMALQSSTDIIFIYDTKEDAVTILNLMENGEEALFPGFLNSIRESEDIHEADRQAFERVFMRLESKFTIHFRHHSNETDWIWMELSGKTICDETGRKTKVIGSIRNIHEQKEREQLENKAARIDMVTGLYRWDVGSRIIEAEAKSGRCGFLALIDLDKFKELNEEYGIDFGDAILEELGNLILKLKGEAEKAGKRIVAVRAGGDEFLLWMRGFDNSTLQAFFERFYKILSHMYQSGKFEIFATSAVYEITEPCESYEAVTEKLCAAMHYCKRRHAGSLTLCSDISEAELVAEASEKRSCNEIASLGSTKKLNLVTKAFNLFERGNQVTPVISVLFAKLGDAYKARAVILTEFRRDFNTSFVSNQWHEEEDAVYDSEICHYSEEELNSCGEKLLSGNIAFEENAPFTQREREILRIPSGLPGLTVPMYDNRNLMGTITLVRRPEQQKWDDTMCGELQEIVRIMESNLNRERYDLASRAKSDFLSRMSHEIRTPMNAIIGMTAIALNKQGQPEEIENCLTKIEQSSRYLLSLINDILDMSKIESGKMKLSETDGSLLDFISDVSDLMGAQIQEKKIRYVEECHLDHYWVTADFMHLKQVVINLIGNAVKFTQPGGSVSFIVREEPDEGRRQGELKIRFSVRDTGIGISKENQKRIFSAFEQAENTIAATYGGTGLGLSISSRLVRMMGGEIHLNSDEGKGSDFSFILSLKTAKAQENQAAADSGEVNIDFEGGRILLVEDNDLNTEIATTLLEMNGFVVEAADNGLTGVEMFKNSPVDYYDLILMDIRMPVMDGLEATKTIRRLPRPDAQTVPIIAMTANAFDDDTKRSIESGMNGHLAKPVDVGELIRVSEQAIRQRRTK